MAVELENLLHRYKPEKTEEKTMYMDIESGETITTEQLYIEYLKNRQEQPNEYNYSFAEYIHNSLTSQNGTLEKIKE